MNKKIDPIDFIGQTPVVKLKKIVSDQVADVYVKLESFNLAGSVKDRVAKAMILEAEAAGKLQSDTVIVEATSGNTGVALAAIGALKGYEVIIALSESVSQERKQLIRAYGATVIETPAEKGVQGSFDVVAEYLAKGPRYFSVSQFTNPANPLIHEQTTGVEISDFFAGKAPTVFVAGIGTGGTITGVGHHLKKIDPKTKIVAVEPEDSAVLTGGTPGPHIIQGIGAGFIPEVLDRALLDEVYDVSGEAARKTAQRLGKEEGLLVGFSSGAAVYAAIKEAEKLAPGQSVLAIAPDNGERYLSTTLYEKE